MQRALLASVANAGLADRLAEVRELVAGLAPWHGRIYLGSEKVAGPSIKEEEEVADEPEEKSEDDEEDMVERRARPQATHPADPVQAHETR